MAIILKVNKVNMFVSSVLLVFWYHLPNFLDTPRMPSSAIAGLDTGNRQSVFDSRQGLLDFDFCHVVLQW
jgi:hypothetical protein